MQRAEAAAQRQTALAEKQGEPTMRWNTIRDGRLRLALLRGDLASAERLAEETMQIGADAGQPDAYMIYGGQLQRIRLYQGRGGKPRLSYRSRGWPPTPPSRALRAGLAQVLCSAARTAPRTPRRSSPMRHVDGFEHVGRDTPPVVDARAVCRGRGDGGRDRGGGRAGLTCSSRGQGSSCATASFPYGHVRSYLGLLAATLGWDERADEHFRALTPSSMRPTRCGFGRPAPASAGLRRWQRGGDLAVRARFKPPRDARPLT